MQKLMMIQKESLADRIDRWSFFDPNTGCKIWFGYQNQTNGRPIIRASGKNKLVYRCAWELAFGDIPKGILVCHRCDNKLCINVIHLFLGSNQDNSDDARFKGRTNRGVNQRDAKLDDDSVRLIRAFHHAGASTLSLSKIYGVTTQTINSASRGSTWSHVT